MAGASRRGYREDGISFDHRGDGYEGESPETRPESIDEQVKRKGIRPVESVETMAQDGFSSRRRNWSSFSRTSTPPATLTLPDQADALRRP
jgi:hypothetical protein